MPTKVITEESDLCIKVIEELPSARTTFALGRVPLEMVDRCRQFVKNAIRL